MERAPEMAENDPNAIIRQAFQQHASEVFGSILDLLAHRQLVDVVLIAGDGGRRVSAHRLILSAISPYFRAMFTNPLREANQNEIRLVGVCNDALQAIVNYSYTGLIELRLDNVEMILETACLFQIQGVMDLCSEHMARQLDNTNCLGILWFADRQNLSALKKTAYEFACFNFEDVAFENEFLHLDADQLASLLKSDDLNIRQESFVFQALMLWMRHDKDNRSKHIPDLLRFIRLSCLTPEFIDDNVADVCSSPEVKRLVLEAMKWHLLPNRRSRMTIGVRPRKSTMGLILAIGGIDVSLAEAHSAYKTLCVDSYCPRLNQWQLHEQVDGGRLQFGLVYSNDKVYIVGGRDGLKTLNTVRCFDAAKKEWEFVASMTTPRHGLAVACLGGPLYAIGGHDGWSYLNSVERLDPSTGEWSFVSPMSVPRSTAGVAVLNGMLYVIGGRDGTSSHNTVECYDPLTNKWSICAPMNERRGGVGVNACRGYIYAVGGNDLSGLSQVAQVHHRTCTVERYDPLVDMWAFAASINEPREAIALALLGERLFACGGFNGRSFLSVVEEYDPDTNEWTEMRPLPQKVASVCVVTVPSNFYEKKEWKPMRPSLFERRFHVYDCYM